MSDVDPTWLSRPLRLGTRRSKLALWQAEHVERSLRERWGAGLAIERVEIVTEGDRVLDRPLAELGGKGLFVTAIEDQLLAGDIDLAVHSMKDLPARLPAGLSITCTPAREDPRDVLVCPGGLAIAQLPAGSRVGTSSLRRAALAQRINDGIEIVPLRGNVPTRLTRLDAGDMDAVVLAAAGLLRLGLHARISERLDVERFCPAAGQGILALECRDGDARVQGLCAPLDHAPTKVAAAAERAFLEQLEGGCQVPMACHCELEGDDGIRVRGVIVGPRGRPYVSATEVGTRAQAAALGARVAGRVLALGGDGVIAQYRAGRAGPASPSV